MCNSRALTDRARRNRRRARFYRSAIRIISVASRSGRISLAWCRSIVAAIGPRAHTHRSIGLEDLSVRRSQTNYVEQIVSKGSTMYKIVRAILVGTVLAVGGGAAASAASAPDSSTGTWALNLAKSKFSPGPAPTSVTRTYAQSAQGTALTVNGVAADGSSISWQATFKYDGKDYPITGSPNYDTLSSKRVNGSTVKSTQKKAGKVVGTTTRTISAHGKVLTLSSKGIDAKGISHDDVAVYDKQ
jgi:hypothetical protein